MNEQWWFLSFAGPNRWLGGCWVRSEYDPDDTQWSIMQAIRKSHELNLNPGGSVRATLMEPDFEPPIAQHGRILAEEDMDPGEFEKV